MNRRRAAALARLAELSYESPDDIARALHPGPVRFLDRDGTQAFLAHLSTYDALVFRGTQVTENWSWEDVRANIMLNLVRWPGGGRAHAGYAEALLDVREEIGAALAAATGPVYLAGHSMGGALATLAATLWRAEAAITFGAPRAGDGALVLRAPVHRVVHALDIAPRYPTLLMGYRHHGRLWKLSRGGRLSRARWRLFDHVIVPGLMVRGLLDHRVGEYVRKLEGAGNPANPTPTATISRMARPSGLWPGPGRLP